MSSILKCNTYQDANGNALFSSDGSGNVTTSASGLQNTPAFMVTNDGTQQSIATGVWTKVTVLDNEVFDTNGCYSGDRFTPNVAGKYWLQASIRIYSTNAYSPYIMILKNSSAINGSTPTTHIVDRQHNNNNAQDRIDVVGYMEANGTTDYFEVYMYHTTGSSVNIGGSGTQSYMYFSGHRLIGA